LLNPLIRKRSRHQWVELLRAAKLPCGPERDYAEVTTDAELLARGMLYDLPSADGGSLQVRMPLEFATTQRAAPQAPPSLAMTPKKN
jgi:crotonobetainyl-CoA:carnitine CoA-transferase CaiB-like acyl-CoA transferase